MKKGQECFEGTWMMFGNYERKKNRIGRKGNSMEYEKGIKLKLEVEEEGRI